MTPAATEQIQCDRNELEAELRLLGVEPKGNTCRCVFHDDGRASASILRGEKGVWRKYCHVCQKFWDVFDLRAHRTNKTLSDVYRDVNAEHGDTTAPPPSKPATEAKPVRVFADIDSLVANILNGVKYYAKQDAKVEEVNTYTNPTTKRIDLVTVKCRLADGSKTFTQGHQREDGLFVAKAGPKPWPLFNRTRLQDAAFVIVVEGEGCVRAITAIGAVATTSPSGAGKASLADWSPLAGKVIYLWPDRDHADPKTGKRQGHEHMNDVAEILRGLDCELHWIDPDSLAMPKVPADQKDGADAVDFLKQFPDQRAKYNALDQVLLNAKPMGETSALHERIEDCIAGKYATIRWPWPTLTRMSQALRPGSICLVCGDPGATKSFFLLESFLRWVEDGIPASLYELEEDSAFWQCRMLAMMSGLPGITEPEWCQANPDAARAAMAQHKAAIDKAAKRLFASPDRPLTYTEILTWIQQQAEAGVRVCGVDPITAAAVVKDQFIHDLNFMTQAKAIARKHGCSVILVTHPKKNGKTKSPLDDTAGGAAFVRFCQTLLWVRTHRPPLEAKFWTPCGNVEGVCDRTVFIAKARNGRGSGRDVGFDFSAETLRFVERGLIVDSDEAAI